MKFLLTTLPTNDLGLLTRALPIASVLRSRGHEVVFSSPAKAPSALLADAGFPNLLPPHPLYDLIADPTASGLLRFARSRSWRRHGSLFSFLREVACALPTKYAPLTTEVWNMDHAGARMGLLNECFVRASTEALKRLMDDIRADVVVDFWNPLAVVAARALEKPVVTVIQADAHPASRGFLWWRTPPDDLPTPTPVINRVLSDYSVPAITRLADLSVGDLTLVVGSRDTDPLPEEVDVTYVGSVLWQKRDAELPSSVASLSRDKPLVWVYSGNPRYGSQDQSLDSIVVLEAAILALAGLDIHVVVTTGHHGLPKGLPPLPQNFVHERYVPGLKMGERSDALLHHGGYGSCQTGLHAGKPAVILPTYSERESNARRMVAIGAAILVPVETVSGKKRVDASSLSAAILRVLADPSYAENAQRAGERLRAVGGAERAADLIERWLERTSRGGGP